MTGEPLTVIKPLFELAGGGGGGAQWPKPGVRPQHFTTPKRGLAHPQPNTVNVHEEHMQNWIFDDK